MINKMDPKIKKIIIKSIMMGVVGGFIFLFGIFILLSAPVWTVHHFEMMQITTILGILVMIIGFLLVLLTPVYCLYKIINQN